MKKFINLFFIFCITLGLSVTSVFAGTSDEYQYLASYLAQEKEAKNFGQFQRVLEDAKNDLPSLYKRISEDLKNKHFDNLSKKFEELSKKDNDYLISEFDGNIEVSKDAYKKYKENDLNKIASSYTGENSNGTVVLTDPEKPGVSDNGDNTSDEGGNSDGTDDTTSRTPSNVWFQ